MTLFVILSSIVFGQTESMEKAALLLDRCSFEPAAEIMILRDEAELSVNNDYSLRLDRHVVFKFFKEKKLDRQFASALFYQTPLFEKYYRISIRTVELDPTTKAPIAREYTTKVNSTHIEQIGIKLKAGALLEVSYSINFPYDEKIADWRFQSMYPTDMSSLKIMTPEQIELGASLIGTYKPEQNKTAQSLKSIRLGNQTQTLPLVERFFQFSQLPAAVAEPFADWSSGHLSRMHLHTIALHKGDDTKTEFVEGQVNHIIESLSTRADFLLRLSGAIDIKSDYDKRLRSITDPHQKIARIYDLVRRHIVWDKVDSLAAPHPLSKVWIDKKGNSTEINLVLVKLLQVYGFDASPLIVSTRANGPIDTDQVAISDFNRTVAYIRLDGKCIVLDATGRYYDFPAIPHSILNTKGLLVSMDRDRWVDVRDTGGFYKNAVTLLGYLKGDSSFMTNVYVNSSGYAKPEHLEILETDSLKGLRKHFERCNKKMPIRHFIVANEYIDTLALAQEFDIKIPLTQSDNLAGLIPTWFSIPDTLFTIAENRSSDINFGYRQQYELVSEFTFPENYELYLLPNNLQLSALNGSVHFEREYHAGITNFSLRQSLVIDRSYYSQPEAVELARFLKKIAALNTQQVMIKKNYNK